jgi:PmbA protein
MLAEQILDLALKSGASHAEVYQVRSRSRPVFFEANRLKQLESSESEGIALRLWYDGRPGLAVAYGSVEPQSLVTKALALSELNEPETIELATNNNLIYPVMGTKVSVEQLLAIGKQTIEELRDSYPEVICSAEFECEEETTALINSQGFHCEYTDISLGYFIGVEWVRGEDFLGIYDGEYTRDKLETKQTVKNIIQRLDWAKNNVYPPTGKVPVLFTANAVTMFWSTIASALNSKTVLEKSSPWSELLGEIVIDKSISIEQNPEIGPYSCPIDDEGTPTQKLTFIDRGRLVQLYTDRTTGKELGKNTTGNGFRASLGNYPSPDLVNLLVKPGKGSLSDLINQLDEAVVIDQILGGGADISGDFSVNIDLGYRIEKGQITGRVKDTMIAGNVYNALKGEIVLGADVQWSSSCYTPSMIVSGLSVIG